MATEKEIKERKDRLAKRIARNKVMLKHRDQHSDKPLIPEILEQIGKHFGQRFEETEDVAIDRAVAKIRAIESRRNSDDSILVKNKYAEVIAALEAAKIEVATTES